MKNLVSFIGVFLLISCKQQPVNKGYQPFVISRGVNLSHWLSQTKRQGQERDTFITEADIRFVASLGYDHVRFPVDEQHLWDELGNHLEDGFAMLHKGIGWLLDNKLKVIVDLHVVRSHYFNAEKNTLWTDAVEQDKFIGLWEQLSAELQRYPVTEVAYEVLNEAVADDPTDWNTLVAKTVAVLREREPQRKIVIGSNKWQMISTFKDLDLPAGDKNIILSFHFYEPFLLTHHQAQWTKIATYKGPINYPGIPVDMQNIQTLDEQTKTEILQHNTYFDKQVIDSMVKVAVVYAEKLGLQLYCGEWGCLPTVDRAIRFRWYKDMREVLSANNVPWSHWEYKGRFGIVEAYTKAVDWELISTLLK